MCVSGEDRQFVDKHAREHTWGWGRRCHLPHGDLPSQRRWAARHTSQAEGQLGFSRRRRVGENSGEEEEEADDDDDADSGFSLIILVGGTNVAIKKVRVRKRGYSSCLLCKCVNFVNPLPLLVLARVFACVWGGGVWVGSCEGVVSAQDRKNVFSTHNNRIVSEVTLQDVSYSGHVGIQNDVRLVELVAQGLHAAGEGFFLSFENAGQGKFVCEPPSRGRW